jgi:SAM-dependent methyltransferase
MKKQALIPVVPSFVERLLHRLHLLPAPIADAFGNVLFGRALTIAVRRGVFEALASDAHTPGEVASMTGLSPAGCELLLASFAVAGYVDKRRSRYALTREARRWLLNSSPHFLGHLLRYFETLHVRWTYLEHSLEHGVPPKPYYESFTEDDWRVYVYAMRDLARLLIGQVMVRITLPNLPRSLLDLGGSHGLYALACCKRYPTLSATIVDFPAAICHTAGIIAEDNAGDRIKLWPADFTKVDFPRDQDCVFLFNVIHGLSEKENHKLIGRAVDALKKGGRLYILDQLREDEGGNHPAFSVRSGGISRFIPLMVGLNLLNEIGGTTYHFEQVKEWCRDVSRIRRMRLTAPGVSLVEIVR